MVLIFIHKSIRKYKLQMHNYIVIFHEEKLLEKVFAPLFKHVQYFMGNKKKLHVDVGHITTNVSKSCCGHCAVPKQSKGWQRRPQINVLHEIMF